TAFVMPLLAPISWNLTGTVLPSLNTELPSAFIGCRIPDQLYITLTLNDFGAAGLPAWSMAFTLTVVVPSGKTEPETGDVVAFIDPSTMSVAVITKLTAAPLALVAVALMSGVAPMTGAVVSTTFTLKHFVAVLP